MTGTVKSIAKEVRIDQVSNSPYYIVEVSCDKNYLKNKKGEEVAIINGMSIKAHIIVGKKLLVNYILEKINIIE